MPSVLRTAALAPLLVIVGCASRSAQPALPTAPAASPPSAAAPEPQPVVVASPVLITPHDPDAARRFDAAWELLQAGHAREAAIAFDALAGDHATEEILAAALFDAGVAWEAAGERERALERFRDTVARFPTGQAGHNAAVRLARSLAWLERWPELAAAAEALLARRDLSDLDRIEGMGLRAVALAQAGEVDAAERLVSKARDIVEARRLGEGGTLPLELAPVFFALGEVRRTRSERITFVPPPAAFGEALERRCQGLLDAQSAYTDAMRSHDPHWAAMSGYRVGALYQRLHDDVLLLPTPKAADTTAKQQLFEGAMRLRYRVLLEKGLKMMVSTVSLGDRTGEASAWVARAREAQVALEKAIVTEKAAIDRLPYTEADLRRALDDLAARPARTP